MDYKLLNDNSNVSYQQQQQNQVYPPQENHPNYMYPNEQSINDVSQQNQSSYVEGQPIQGAVVINMSQEEAQYYNQNNQIVMGHPQQPYMERPFMSNPMYDDKQQAPQAPPPPPQLQNPIITDASMQQPFKNEYYDIRNISEIEECKHSNPQKYLYITSPKVLLSALIIGFYIVGVISLIVGLIILIIVAVVALSDGKKADCNADCCKICDGGMRGCDCTCACFNICDCCLRTTDICCLNTRSGVIYYNSYGYDYNYYRYRYHRKRHYHEYQGDQNLTSCCDALGRCFYEVFCCACCDNISLGNTTDTCMVNKVEVYCTECNSKLKEEWTGTKHIAPSLLLGMFGIIILVVSILLLQHYDLA